MSLGSLHKMTIEEKFTDERNRILYCLVTIAKDVEHHVQTHKQIVATLNEAFDVSVYAINNMIVDYIHDLSHVNHAAFLNLVHWIVHTAENDLFPSENDLFPSENDLFASDESCIFNLAKYRSLKNIDWETYWRPDNLILALRPHYVEILLHYYSSYWKNWNDLYYYTTDANFIKVYNKDVCEQLLIDRQLLERLKYIKVSKYQ
jgi:hypothetical protein